MAASACPVIHVGARSIAAWLVTPLEKRHTADFAAWIAPVDGLPARSVLALVAPAPARPFGSAARGGIYSFRARRYSALLPFLAVVLSRALTVAGVRIVAASASVALAIAIARTVSRALAAEFALAVALAV